MDNKICYLNTDLDLTSTGDLSELAAEFERADVRALHVTQADDGSWYAIFETHEQYDQPEANLAALLSAVESLSAPLRAAWDACTIREFNIGYDCGAEPWAFNQGLSASLLQRLAASGASLRFTLYPDRDPISHPAAES